MGTKRNPGPYGCYSRAEPDEPVFVLLGRDPVASVVVKIWADLREQLGKTEAEVIHEARVCAVDMILWADGLGKSEQVQEAIAKLDAERERLLARVLKLESLCGRAADVIAEQVSVNVADGGLRGRQELDDVVRELRSA
jgi:hypothetical protein